MRVLISVFAFLLLTSSVMIAQEVSFGFKGGVNFSNASKGDFNGESFTSFHIGAVMEALYDNKFAIQPEIIYSRQGFSFMENTIGRDLKTSYINVPVMFKYYVRKAVFIEAGPQIGFLNSAKLKTTVNDTQDTQEIKKGLRTNDLSFDLGLGIQLNNGLNFNARYCYGLTNFSARLSDSKFKNRVLQFAIGYMF